MKTTLIGATALAALASASPAMAQSSATFTTQTTVPAYCSQFSTGQAPMDLGVLTGPAGQTLTAFGPGAQTERQLSANFYCNAPSTITIKADPLINEAVPSVTDADFTNRVDYTAILTWSAMTNSVSSTAANAQVISAAQANIGELKLKLANPATSENRRPVAGNYAGQVHLTIALAQ